MEQCVIESRGRGVWRGEKLDLRRLEEEWRKYRRPCSSTVTKRVLSQTSPFSIHSSLLPWISFVMKRLRKWRLCKPSNLLDPVRRMVRWTSSFLSGRGEVLLREYSLAPSSLRDCSPRLLGYFHFYFLWFYIFLILVFRKRWCVEIGNVSIFFGRKRIIISKIYPW